MRRRGMVCPVPERLWAYLESGEEGAPGTGVHVLSCAECRATLTAWESLAAAIPFAAPTEEVIAPTFAWRRIAAAASILAAGCTAIAVSLWGGWTGGPVRVTSGTVATAGGATALVVGAPLRLGAGDEASFPDGTVVRIRAPSLLSLAAPRGDERLSLVLDGGTAGFAVAARAGAVVVRTPDARVRVVGTRFVVREVGTSASGTSATFVEVEDGVVEVSTESGACGIAPGEYACAVADAPPYRGRWAPQSAYWAQRIAGWADEALRAGSRVETSAAFAEMERQGADGVREAEARVLDRSLSADRRFAWARLLRSLDPAAAARVAGAIEGDEE